MKTKLIGAVALLLASGLALGQDSPPAKTKATPKESQTTKKSGMSGGSSSSSKKSELELALEEALKNNPDLRVAVAKAAEAEAQVSRARAQVVQKVVAAWQAIDAAKANKAMCEARMDRMARLRKVVNGGVTEDEYQAAVASAAQAKATLAAAEADLEYLTGKGKTAEKYAALIATYYYRLADRQKESTAERAALEYWLKGGSSKGPVVERIRKALEKKTRFTFKATSAREVLKSIQGDAERSGIHVQANTKGEGWDEKVTATFDDVPLSTVVQLLEDALGDHRVVVRDYGLLIAPQGKLPPNAVTLGEFLKSKAAVASKAEVHGKVTGVQKDLVGLSIGSDAGVKKGDVLEVYRLGDNPRYLGKVKVTEVKAKSALSEVVGKLTEAIKIGDEVGNVSPDTK
jgi:hypothetical protein